MGLIGKSDAFSAETAKTIIQISIYQNAAEKINKSHKSQNLRLGD